MDNAATPPEKPKSPAVMRALKSRQDAEARGIRRAEFQWAHPDDRREVLDLAKRKLSRRIRAKAKDQA